MDDTISRQAALIAIRNLYPDMPRVDFMDKISNWQKRNKQYIECENAIEKLPSAQPSLYEKLNEAHNEGYDVGYWAGRRDYEQKWIPVTEHLPDEFVSVQAHMTDAGSFPSTREAYRTGGEWFFPALNEYHPVDQWAEFLEPSKEEPSGNSGKLEE